MGLHLMSQDITKKDFFPAVGVWEKYTKVLYCTRHSFINKLNSEKVDENVIKILNWIRKGIHYENHYGGDPLHLNDC